MNKLYPIEHELSSKIEQFSFVHLAALKYFMHRHMLRIASPSAACGGDYII